MKDNDWAAGLWWIVLIIALSMLLLGCTRKIYVPVEQKTIETVTLHDTIVEVKLDLIRDSIITPDTISYIENKYAYSAAKWSNGLLYHSLNMKDYFQPVKLQFIEKERWVEVPAPYPVEVIKKVERELSLWQRLSMWLGNIALIAGISVLFIYLIKRKFK